MTLTYDQFKTDVIDVLWRPNDTDFSNALDNIIARADSELDRRTRDWQARQKTVVIAPESQDYDLSTNHTDLDSVLAVINNSTDSYFSRGTKEFQQTTLSTIYGMRSRNPSGPIHPVFGVDEDDGTLYLRLVAPALSASSPADLTMIYRKAVGSYSANDTNFLAEDYPDLYLNTVLKHCALYLREDDRMQLYKAMADEAYAEAEIDDKHNLQFGGSPLRMRPHRQVP